MSFIDKNTGAGDQIRALCSAGVKEADAAELLGVSTVEAKVALSAAENFNGVLDLNEEELLMVKAALLSNAIANPDANLRAKINMFLYDRHHVPAALRFKAKHGLGKTPQTNIMLVQQVLDEARRKASI